MALLDFPLVDPTQRMLYYGDVYLRYPRKEDYADWAALRELSRDYLEPWEPLWSEDELSPAAYRRRLRYYAREIKMATTRPYAIFRDKDSVMLGACVMSNIRRGVAQSASLGYWIGEPYAGKGYGTQAVKAVATHAFEQMELERLEAATLRTNDASQKVLMKSGFKREGEARQYLQINGKRQDHILFGLIKEDFHG